MEHNLEAQYRALRENCGLWSRPPAKSVVVAGEDRQRLLNGLLTCDVTTLGAGQGAQGFFTEVKGHVVSEVVVRSTTDSLLLELPLGMAAQVAAHIEKYVVADRVEIRFPIEYEMLTLIGPRSADWVAVVLNGKEIPTSPWGHFEIELEHRPVLMAADEHFGLPAVSFWLPTAAAEHLTGMLLSGPAADRRPLIVGGEVVETVRIEEGMPLFGRDYGPDHLPQESGLEAAVSYTKGCYLGQEVVARLHYRGQISRRVTLLRGLSGEAPEVGSELFLEGREAGVISSVTKSPMDGRISALAMLQRRAFDSGTELQLADGGSLRVE